MPHLNPGLGVSVPNPLSRIEQSMDSVNVIVAICQAFYVW
ncbi:hypothetical protein MMALV_15680 [Candidatus Methanomethylophilus alvi Mx1201]|uniref:Uncharacterized protein n=1 Tax=Methanomethylophilus alvi (strain Mx1201) TaxID=1236689 RepID=M9SLH3_METAX|nr:hypothetical protein MMALV_15680 [Candidatus Methanomethylophilus alvi Mx1201]